MDEWLRHTVYAFRQISLPGLTHPKSLMAFFVKFVFLFAMIMLHDLLAIVSTFIKIELT